MRKEKVYRHLFWLVLVGLLWTPYSNSALAATSKASQKLLVATGVEPTTMDPTLVNSGADYQVIENYGEWLFNKTPSGDLQPGLAAQWKMSADGKEIDFTLRKGVRFHSGDLFTAKDVLFSYERSKAKNPAGKTRLRSVDHLELIDDYHFKLHFKTPDVTFIPNRGNFMIASKSYFDRVGEDKFVRQPVGTGPYKLVTYVPGEYMEIERFDGYWGEKPSVKEARIYFVVEDTTRVAKLKTGEVDIITNCPYPAVKDVEANPGLKIVKYSNGHPTASIVFQTRNPNTPWHDRRVRLAMAYAIDWKTIVDKILLGIPNHWDFLAPFELGYDPSQKPYPYDPKKAKELLAAAGYPNGFEFNLYWLMSGRLFMARESSEAIASYLEAVGIKTKLVGMETGAHKRKRDQAKKDPKAEYVTYYTAGRANGPDPTYNLALFFGTDGGFSFYSNPELDKVVAEGKATMNNEKRAELIKKAVNLIHEDVPSIPIFNTVSVYAMKKNIEFRPTLKHNMDLLLVKDITIK